MEKITNEMKFEWYNSLTFQDMIDCALKNTIVSIKYAESDLDFGISDRYCSKSIHYNKFNDIKYRRARLTDKTIINPDTLLKDIKGNNIGHYWSKVIITISNNDIKKCRSKRNLCRRIFIKLKPYLYFQVGEYDYIHIIDIISRDLNFCNKNYENQINQLTCEISQKKEELRKIEEELKKKEEELKKLNIHQKMYESIHEG